MYMKKIYIYVYIENRQARGQRGRLYSSRPPGGGAGPPTGIYGQRLNHVWCVKKELALIFKGVFFP